MKRCTKCGIEKDESKFSPDNRHKDGLYSWCKLCNNEYHTNYCYNVRQQCFALFNSKCQRCGETNTDVLSINHIQSPTSDIYKGLYRSGWNLYKQILDNPNLVKYFTLLCANCNLLDYYEKSRYYSRALIERSIRYRKKKEKICELWNNKCFRCFRTFPVELLTVNHVNGGGRKETRKYGTGMFQCIPTNELINRIDSGELEILCFSCNCNRTESSKWIKVGKAQKKTFK